MVKKLYFIGKCLVIFLVTINQVGAIIVGNQQAQTNLTEDVGKFPHDKTQQAEAESIDQGFYSDVTNSTTFYYDPNAFLINKEHQIKNKITVIAEDQHQTRENTKRKYVNESLPEPASPTMTSGRNGRMLDLDALMGDLVAAQANREKNSKISGNRQSRFLNQAGQQTTLEVGGGKKLHIQGFIPIVGLKDVNQQEADSHNDDESNTKHLDLSSSSSSFSSQQHRPKLHDLPYEQSSMGHASFGVQRYLVNSDQLSASPNHQQMNPNQLQQQQQIEAKYSMLSSLKKPLKRLTDFSGSGSSEAHQQTNCLCVPFYMCKNGIISESSLGKAQIQQMILQQHQQQQQALLLNKQQSLLVAGNIDQAAELKSASQLITSAPQVNMQPQLQQPQYADSYVQLDERSLDRDSVLVTMSSLISANSGPLNVDTAGDKNSSQLNWVDSADNSGAGSRSEQQTTTASSEQNSFSSSPFSIAGNSEETKSLTDNLNSTNNNNNDQSSSSSMSWAQDYSQEILGRMLGLKSSSSSSSNLQQPQQQSLWKTNQQAASSASGSCGLLRTCCQIPANLLPTQQDAANERFMSQYTSAASFNSKPQQQQQPLFAQAASELIPQQVSARQKYQNQQQQQAAAINKKLPYGFPTRMSQHNQQAQASNLQPLNMPPPQSFDVGSPSSSSFMMAHRSNLFNQPPNMQQQLAQYTRGVAPLQQLQSFQHQQQPQNQFLSNNQATTSIQAAASSRNIPNQLQSISVYPSSSLTHQSNIMKAPVQLAGATNGAVSGSLLGTRKILDGRCGIRQSAGITGRVQTLQYHESSADFGEYPAQAAILKRLGGSESLFVCGGTLISQYWVATAAHCIKKYSQNDLKIRLGEWDVHRDDEFYPFVEKEVRDLIIHPEFVAGNLVNDIALLRLDSPVDPSLPHVNPACLPVLDESFSRQRCWVTGWGKDSFGQKGSFQAVLREVELPVMGQAECEQALRQTRLGQHYRLHSGFICAGGEGGRDACEGDGGSGLYCYHEGVIKVAGLVSWGIGCGQAGVPGVYVSIAHYRPWIENIISIDEDIYSPDSNMIGSSLISERNTANNNNNTNNTTNTGSDSSSKTSTN